MEIKKIENRSDEIDRLNDMAKTIQEYLGNATKNIEIELGNKKLVFTMTALPVSDLPAMYETMKLSVGINEGIPEHEIGKIIIENLSREKEAFNNTISLVMKSLAEHHSNIPKENLEKIIALNLMVFAREMWDLNMPSPSEERIKKMKERFKRKSV